MFLLKNKLSISSSFYLIIGSTSFNDGLGAVIGKKCLGNDFNGVRHSEIQDHTDGQFVSEL